MFCQCCQRLQDLDLLFSNEKIKHHKTFAALVQASSKGCQLCACMLKAIKHCNYEAYVRIVTSPAKFDQECPSQGPQIYCSYKVLDSYPYFVIDRGAEGDLHGTARALGYMAAFTTSDNPLTAMFSGNHVQKDVRSDPCLQLIKTWMAKCQENHPSCNPLPRPPPSRVIDVRLPGEEPRLYLPNPLEVLTWVTLSHCWGGESPLTTTLATLQQHCDSIPMCSLPPVFRDAVDLTRSLGLRYLWIDSLCIIQDSHADWAVEATNMHSIYSGATLCIAASAARKCSDGIFASGNFHRNEFEQWATISCHSARHGIEGLLSFRQFTGSGEIYERELRKEPLHTRAWVLQESILSPRRLDFGSTQLS